MTAIKREVIIGDCRLILGDCLEVTPLLGKVDAVVTDPPYGINAGNMQLGKWASSRLAKSDWDTKIPDLSCLPNVKSIIWGGNYFNLPPSRAFLVWDKGAGFKGRSFSECEMAWCSFNSTARLFSYDPLANGDYKERLHKTQKPVPLMKWCLTFIPEAKIILDPFMGSGSTGVACLETGRKFIGIEINENHFNTACKRIDQAQRQGKLFAPPKQQPKPQGLF